jgi:hypothetical protein
VLEDPDSNGFKRVDKCAKLTSKKGQTGIRDLPDMNQTAKKQYRKFETNIPRKGTARLQSQFLHSCFVCEPFIYSSDRPAYTAAGK